MRFQGYAFKHPARPKRKRARLIVHDVDMMPEVMCLIVPSSSTYSNQRPYNRGRLQLNHRPCQDPASSESTKSPECAEIHYLAPFLFEEIEPALPVIPDHEGVDVILVDVGALLSPVLLGNNQVNVTNRLKKLLSLLIGEVTLLALLVPIEPIGREGND